MKKIAFFIPDLRGGGAERTVANLLKEWENPDYVLELVLVNADGVYLDEIPARVTITDLGKKRAFQAALPLRRYLRHNKPDVLICHLSHLNIIALLVKKIFSLDTPLVLVEQSVLAPGPVHGKERMVRWLMKKLYPSASTIVAVSRNTARDLEARLGLEKNKILTIYNPVVSKGLFVKAAQLVADPWLDNKDRPVFISVGRLEPQKGFANLLRAFALVRKEFSARLLILGEGSLRKELEEECRMLGIAEDVRMPGFVRNPYAFMSRCEVFVLASAWEGLPSVLVEAMACGCRLVATRSPGGQDEILEDGRYGVLVPVNDPGALARAMTGSLEGRWAKDGKAVAMNEWGNGAVQEEESAGRAERIRRAAEFSVERAGAAYTELIEKILGERGSKDLRERGSKGEFPRGGVLHIITGLEMGGAERMLCDLLPMMKERGFGSVVLSLSGGGVLAGRLEAAGIPVYFMGMKPGGVPSPAAMLRLIRLVRRIRPGLIQGWMYHGDLAAQFVRMFLFPGVPVVWSIHHSPGDGSGGSHRGDPIAGSGRPEVEKPMTKKIIRLGAWMSRKPDAIVYVSQASRRQHIALGYDDKKAVTIPNGVDPVLFAPSAEARAAVRNELGLRVEQTVGLKPGGLWTEDRERERGQRTTGGQGGEFLIGLLARYHPMKDHESFLRAAALLSARHPDVHFLLAGTGVDSGNAVLTGLIREPGIADRVHLLGERADSHRLMASLDLLTVSSCYGEAFPLVLLEAMACGVPCVSTDIGDAALIIGDTGFVVAPRDPSALAGAWERMMGPGAVDSEKLEALDGGNPGETNSEKPGAGKEGVGAAERERMGKAAREKVLNFYTLEAVAKEYEKLYRACGWDQIRPVASR